jgi:hypothetical protein
MCDREGNLLREDLDRQASWIILDVFWREEETLEKRLLNDGMDDGIRSLMRKKPQANHLVTTLVDNRVGVTSPI